MPSLFNRYKSRIPSVEDALPGRAAQMPGAGRHLVLDAPLQPPFPEEIETAVFGLGCFWGAERLFWQASGVYTTAVGYAGGATPNPTYEEVSSGRTGHTEVVLVAWDSAQTSFDEMLKIFWEGHNPTQGMRQGNDVGTQYRSAIFTTSQAQLAAAEQSALMFAERLKGVGFGDVTTEIAPSDAFYFAEDYHQQYLAKNPNGYCGLGGTGVTCPIGVATAE